MTDAPTPYDTSEDGARALDAADPLREARRQFHVPRDRDGRDVVYLCGNSLGLQPRSVREALDEELDAWARLAVDGHFDGPRPWFSYHEQMLETGARLVGARAGEVVMMNSLTANLHLMMVSFFRPTRERFKILMDEPSFPSDSYAIVSQLEMHGLDPDTALLRVRPRPGEACLRTEDVLERIECDGDAIALVLIGGVNFLTGQLYDNRAIAAAARARGCVVGMDLAHAAGNAVLELHDWGVDFAVWCSYKYLNSGPGAVAGCFVHERHADRPELHRLAGWWGNDPKTRFRMQLEEQFVPQPGAAGWQLSNPPILATAPLYASLRIFDAIGMPALRRKSVHLTGYLAALLAEHAPEVKVLTPTDPESRGCQLSLVVPGGRETFRRLGEAGVVCDFREPEVIRAAPVPLYNSYHDVWRFVDTLRAGRS